MSSSSAMRREIPLVASDAMYRMIFERASEGVVVLGKEYEIVLANPRICDLLGRPREALIGRKFEELVHPEDLPTFHEQQRRRRRGESGHYECRVAKGNTGDVLCLLISATPIPGADNEFNGSFAFVTDVTARKELEREKEDLQVRSENAARMASLGEMAGGISHEINNPLAVISAIVEQQIRTLENRELDRSEIIPKLEKVRSMCDRIAKIINGLHSFSRDGGGDPFSYESIDEIMREILDFCGSRFKNSRVELRLPIGVFSHSLECRKVQISQVLLNLLNNAFDAVAGTPGAWVALDCKAKRVDGRDWIELSVTDSGAGIPPSVAAKIMEPFFTTKEVGKGTGLGLSISDGIVKSHNGRIYLDTQNPNTRFVVQLPVRRLASN
jgi:PAS domain S-box-containing protein